MQQETCQQLLSADPLPWEWGSKYNFFRIWHAAYQIKWNRECINMQGTYSVLTHTLYPYVTHLFHKNTLVFWVSCGT